MQKNKILIMSLVIVVFTFGVVLLTVGDSNGTIEDRAINFCLTSKKEYRQTVSRSTNSVKHFCVVDGKEIDVVEYYNQSKNKK